MNENKLHSWFKMNGIVSCTFTLLHSVRISADLEDQVLQISTTSLLRVRCLFEGGAYNVFFLCAAIWNWCLIRGGAFSSKYDTVGRKCAQTA